MQYMDTSFWLAIHKEEKVKYLKLKWLFLKIYFFEDVIRGWPNLSEKNNGSI